MHTYDERNLQKDANPRPAGSSFDDTMVRNLEKFGIRPLGFCKNH